LKRLLLVLLSILTLLELFGTGNQEDCEKQLKMKNPVILVHGFMDTKQKMAPLAEYLRNEGFEVYSVTLKPSSGQIGIDILAQQLQNYIDSIFSASQRFKLVGFSMGGLICRYYVQRLGGISRVDHLITISSPHNGTLTAYLRNNPGSIQMRLGSEFIKGLNSDITSLNNIKYTSIWNPLDLMIIPASSSRTGVGREVKVWNPLHPLIVRSRKCLEIVKFEILR
jgi:triacylglycerol lipase